MTPWNMSNFLRRLIVFGDVIIPDFSDVREMNYLLGKIGSNINQIARHYNGGGARSTEMFNRTMDALSDLYDLKKEIQRLGGERYGGT